MKVLLHTEFEKQIGVSGLGKAIQHQVAALEANNIPYTRDKNDDYDIAHFNFYGLGSYFLAKKAKKQGKKVIYHAHSTEEDFRNSFIFSNQIAPLFKWWICKCYRLGDEIITPTPYSKKLLEGYGLKNIHAISNGIDIKFFKKDAALGEKFRKKYHFKKSDKVVMGIGLFLERKGILDFVELARRMPEYKFIWFGYTDPKIIPKRVRNAIKNRPENLQFPGHVSAEEIKGALSGADLYIFPTHEETEGIPAMEACACEQRIIVRDIPVFEGWLEDGKTAYKAQDVDDFEKKIKMMLNDELKDLTAAAKKVAEKRSLENVGKELVKVYYEAMKK